MDVIPAIAACGNMQIRTNDPANNYFESVIKRADLSQICDALKNYFGEPFKDFGQKLNAPKEITRSIDNLGGVRKDQALFLKMLTAPSFEYAMLWPWNSDTGLITLKIGVYSD